MSPAPSLLEAVIDRIIPADDDPGALLLGTPAYVCRRLAERPDLAAAITAGLAALPEDFGERTGEGRDAALRKVEHEAWFAGLVELTQEGFWADPDNGGNRDARSWQIIGFSPGPVR